jgi:M6 family metalloprotease-like protein
MTYQSRIVLVWTLLCALVMNPLLVSATTQSRTGLFVWWHGDDRQGRPVERYQLQSGDAWLSLQIPESVLRAVGGARALDGQMVTVQFAPVAARDSDGVAVVSITPVDRRISSRAMLTGPQAWLTVMCKFADVAAEPRDYTYFSNMYNDSFPGMNHYWKEVSFGFINVDGSKTAGSGWYTMPQPRSYYVDADGDGNLYLEFSRVWDDCAGAAIDDADFSQYIGVNLMFNADLDGYAWGGKIYRTFDGYTRVWNITVQPTWGYEHINVIAHEMGHGFDLPHSSGQYGAIYDNVWDVMSDSWYACDYHVVYGCVGQHTIAYHKDLLGWIDADDKAEVNGVRLMRLDHIAMANPDYYHMATIPITGVDHFYTVEARKPVGYDIKLPNKAVIIHEVERWRDNPAQVIDVDGNRITDDGGAQWLVGETFVNGAINVDVVAEHDNGFTVLIRTVDQPVIWGNAGVAGATITYTGGSTTADAYGDYAFVVPSGWSGVVEVSKSGTEFSPSSRTFGAVTDDIANTNFVVATAVSNPMISGNAGVAGATISYTGGSTTADGNGDYAFVVSSGWSGSITPSKGSYRFAPASMNLTNVTTHQPTQDFDAVIDVAVAGNVGVADATISYTGGTTTSDSNGDYRFVVTSKWAGSVTPSKPGYTFAPATIDLGVAHVDRAGQDFVALADVMVAGNAGVAGATITYTGGSTTTDRNGNYTFMVASGWSGSIRPSKPYYRFKPASLNITGLTTNHTGQRFAAALNRQSMTIRSNGALDGILQESLRLNGTGVAATYVGNIVVGDTFKRQQIRGLLSFDTDLLPDAATITKVTLRLTYAGVSGGNPMDTHGPLFIDVRTGWFGSSYLLQATDFQASATQLGVGQIRRETATRYGATWTRGMTTRINTRGDTQMRLRFGTKHDNDRMDDTIQFYDGDALLARRPALLIEYIGP